MKLPWRGVRPLPGLPVTVQTSLTASEAGTLAHLSAGRRVLEVGSAYGYSTIIMAAGAAHVTTIDHHRHMDSLAILQENLRACGLADSVEILVGDAGELLPGLPDASFDGAFIDGDHSRLGVLRDAYHASRLVRVGGWLAFHDWDEDTCPEVRPALEEFFGNKVNNGILTDTLLVIHLR